MSLIERFHCTCGQFQYTWPLSVYLQSVSVYTVPFSILAVSLSILSPFQYTCSQSQYTQSLLVYLRSQPQYTHSQCPSIHLPMFSSPTRRGYRSWMVCSMKWQKWKKKLVNSANTRVPIQYPHMYMCMVQV